MKINCAGEEVDLTSLTFIIRWKLTKSHLKFTVFKLQTCNKKYPKYPKFQFRIGKKITIGNGEFNPNMVRVKLPSQKRMDQETVKWSTPYDQVCSTLCLKPYEVGTDKFWVIFSASGFIKSLPYKCYTLLHQLLMELSFAYTYSFLLGIGLSP